MPVVTNHFLKKRPRHLRFNQQLHTVIRCREYIHIAPEALPQSPTHKQGREGGPKQTRWRPQRTLATSLRHAAAPMAQAMVRNVKVACATFVTMPMHAASQCACPSVCCVLLHLESRCPALIKQLISLLNARPSWARRKHVICMWTGSPPPIARRAQRGT